MMEDTAQSSKVEQDDMGAVLQFPLKRPKSVPSKHEQPKKGTSPNKGHAASGRTREYMTESEVTQLLEAAKKTAQNGWRNYCIILMMFRHGLRVSEAADLRWTDVDFAEGTIFIRRLKGSKSTTHFFDGLEIRALKRLQREQPQSPYVFVDKQGKPLAGTAIASMIKRLGKDLFSFPIHSHMLRHSCGHALAMKGTDTRTLQDYLGHRCIQHTERYTQLSPIKFKGIWG